MHELLNGFPVVVSQNVVWGEMDSYQHVNNVVYFRYFENARLEYINQVGWPDIEEETGIGPILASTTAKFRKPLTYPDRIHIGARLQSIEPGRLVLEHRIVSEMLEAIATEGSGTVVSFHYEKGEKAPLPEALLKNIETLERSVRG